MYPISLQTLQTSARKSPKGETATTFLSVDEEGAERQTRKEGPGKESDAEGGLAADGQQQPKATTTGRSPNGILGLSVFE